MAKKIDFDNRYSEDWKARSRLCKRATSNRCCLCGKKGRLQSHHAVYCDKKQQAIAGKELPGVHIFPVCQKCHKDKCHSSKNWIQDRKNPALFNRNTIGFYKVLVKGFDHYKVKK